MDDRDFGYRSTPPYRVRFEMPSGVAAEWTAWSLEGGIGAWFSGERFGLLPGTPWFPQRRWLLDIYGAPVALIDARPDSSTGFALWATAEFFEAVQSVTGVDQMALLDVELAVRWGAP